MSVSHPWSFITMMNCWLSFFTIPACPSPIPWCLQTCEQNMCDVHTIRKPLLSPACRSA